MKNTLFGFEPITSISFSNDEIIENIMLLHGIERFDLDCTYSIGHFWENLPQPKYKSDLLPKRKDIIEASSDNLPFESESMKSIMFDPPFVIAGETYKDNDKGSSIIAKRFEGYKDFTDFNEHRPYDCKLIGIELIPSATPLKEFKHPKQSCYLLGAEDNGLTKEAIEHCQ